MNIEKALTLLPPVLSGCSLQIDERNLSSPETTQFGMALSGFLAIRETDQAKQFRALAVRKAQSIAVERMRSRQDADNSLWEDVFGRSTERELELEGKRQTRAVAAGVGTAVALALAEKGVAALLSESHASSVRSQVWKIMSFGIERSCGRIGFRSEVALTSVNTRLGGGGRVDRWFGGYSNPKAVQDVPFMTAQHDESLRKAICYFTAGAIADEAADPNALLDRDIRAYLSGSLALSDQAVRSVTKSVHASFGEDQYAQAQLAEATLAQFASAVARARRVDATIPLGEIQTVSQRLAEYHPHKGRREAICTAIRTHGPEALGLAAGAASILYGNPQFAEVGASAAKEISKVVLAGVLPRKAQAALVSAAENWQS